MSAANPMRRRNALFGLCCACATPRLARSADTADQSTVDTVEIAPGVHVRRGVDEDATGRNGDAIANIGFIVGGHSVAVIDPGGSLPDGLALRARVRAVTDKPIRHVILSHVHPDHVFGAAAFRADAPSFIGHAALPDALQARGDFYQRGLRELLGEAAAGDVVIPDRLVGQQATSEQARIDLGGRVLTLRAHHVAHTNCDLSVLDAATGTWFSGDLVFVGRVPSLDGSLRGWIAELESLRSLPAARVVPGHGPAAANWPAAADDQARYLHALLRDVVKLIADGGSIEQAPAAAQEERSRWALFDDYNGRNATVAFKELEWE